MSPVPGDGLARGIRLPQAVALVAGTVIGVAIFVQPAEVARRVGSPAELLAVWATAAGLALAGALLCAELASTFTAGGGVYRYLTEAYGRLVGFLWSWALFWTIHTCIVAAVAVVCARSLLSLVPTLSVGERPLAVASILLVTAVNVAGVRSGAGLQTRLTVAKVAVLLALAAAGLWIGGDSPGPAVPAAAAPLEEAGQGLGGALIAALFTFGGWHLVTFPTSETVRPRRTLPRAIVLGFLAVAVTYAALNLCYLRVLGLARVAASPHVAADAAFALAGAPGRTAVAAIATLSALGALAGLVLAGPRIYFAAAHDGAAPRWLGSVHPRFRTPHRALLVQAVWASLLTAVGSYGALYSRALVVEWIFFGLLGVAVMVLRRRGLARRFSAPFYPLLPLLFTATAAALVAERLLADPGGGAVGLAFTAAGVPVYLLARRRRAASRAEREPRENAA